MATDRGAVPPVEHDDTANLRLALMEKWREACGRAAEGFGRRGDIPFYSSALSALAGECADDMGKSGRIAEAAVAMLADALMDMDLQGYAERPEKAAGRARALRLVDRLRGRPRAPARGDADVRDAPSRRDRRCRPGCAARGAENLVGPSDTATCTIDILDGSQEGNREVLDECAAMMTDDDPDIGDFCFITFMLRDGSPKTGIFCKIRDSRRVQDAWERAYSDYRRGRRIGPAE